MNNQTTEKWKIYRDSSIPYIGEITSVQADGCVLDLPPIFCEFLWERWHNFDRSELVIRSLVVRGIHVDNCRNFVEKGFTVLEWFTISTINEELSTSKEQKPGIRIF